MRRWTGRVRYKHREDGFNHVGDWYYIGHYGQLGPLTREQVDELIDGGVIARETYVWKFGMTDWLPADRVPELSLTFIKSTPISPPPPPSPQLRQPQMSSPVPYGMDPTPMPFAQYMPALNQARSDRSRTLGGVLQLLIPGVGRMYLGYAAYGVLQLVLSPCGVGWIWSLIDGIIILAGGVKLDGYGRTLPD